MPAGDLALQDSNKQWIQLACGLEADISHQPALLQGGELRDYQMKASRTAPITHQDMFAGAHTWLPLLQHDGCHCCFVQCLLLEPPLLLVWQYVGNTATTLLHISIQVCAEAF